ncbi:hypothetical protein ACJX0J_020310, partial [Zea mays]
MIHHLDQKLHWIEVNTIFTKNVFFSVERVEKDIVLLLFFLFEIYIILHTIIIIHGLVPTTWSKTEGHKKPCEYDYDKFW